MSQSQWYQFRYVPWKVWVKYLKMSTSDSFKIVQTPASTFFLRADTKNGQKLFLLPWNCEVSRRCQIYHVKALFLRLLPISNMSSPCSLFSEHCPPCLCRTWCMSTMSIWRSCRIWCEMEVRFSNVCVKKVLQTYSYAYLWHTMWFHA